MKKILSLFIFLLILVGIVSAIAFILKQTLSPGPKETTDNRVKIEQAKAAMTINKDFTFFLKDTKGKDSAKFTYTVDAVELRDEIVIKGKKATAIAGKTFLIVNLKITNTSEQPISVNTGAYIRLSINDNEKELLAPDIHNDPVEVQPISTKITRVGFPLSDSDSKLKLLVGEVSKDKTTIDITF